MHVFCFIYSQIYYCAWILCSVLWSKFQLTWPWCFWLLLSSKLCPTFPAPGQEQCCLPRASPPSRTLVQRVNKSLKHQLPGVGEKVLLRSCPWHKKSKEFCFSGVESVEQLWSPPVQYITLLETAEGNVKVTWQKWSIGISGHSCSKFLLDYTHCYPTVIIFKLTTQWIFKNNVFECHKVSLVSSVQVI